MRELNILFLSIGFLLAGPAGMYAQSDNPWFGFRAGAVISKTDFKGGMLDVDYQNKFGLDLAAVFDFPIGDLFSIGPEVHWVQRGSKVENDLGSSYTQKMDYLHIPALVRLHFGRPSGLQAFAGPSLDYLLAAKLDYDVLDDIDNKDDFEELTWGGVIGAGIQLGPLLIDARYNFTFGDLNASPDFDKVTNQTFGGGVTIMF